jgi:hypothetical protein
MCVLFDYVLIVCGSYRFYSCVAAMLAANKHTPVSVIQHDLICQTDVLKKWKLADSSTEFSTGMPLES